MDGKEAVRYALAGFLWLSGVALLIGTVIGLNMYWNLRELQIKAENGLEQVPYQRESGLRWAKPERKGAEAP